MGVITKGYLQNYHKVFFTFANLQEGDLFWLQFFAPLTGKLKCTSNTSQMMIIGKVVVGGGGRWVLADIFIIVR